MGLCLRHTSLFLTYVLAPLCAISNFNYEQVNPRNFPAAMLLHGRLSFRKPELPSPSSGLHIRLQGNRIENKADVTAIFRAVGDLTIYSVSPHWRKVSKMFSHPELCLANGESGDRQR